MLERNLDWLKAVQEAAAETAREYDHLIAQRPASAEKYAETRDSVRRNAEQCDEAIRQVETEIAALICGNRMNS